MVLDSIAPQTHNSLKMTLHSIRLTTKACDDVATKVHADVTLFEDGFLNGSFEIENFKSTFSRFDTVKLRSVALLLARLAGDIDDEIRKNGFCAPAVTLTGPTEG